MSAYPILTALSLPAVTTFPSVDCFQWSEDGHAVLLTRNAVYILTPEPGIAVDTSGAIKQNLDRSLTLGSQKPIGWLRTIIEGDKGANMHQWVIQCQDWATVSLGSTDLSFNSIACSPSNVSANAGCIYAVLDSNSEVFLFQPVKNPFTGQWEKMANPLAVLEEAAAVLEVDREEKPMELLRTLHQQSTCISWSSQPDFGASPVHNLDGSLLAVGNRAGCVNLLRFVRNANLESGMQHVRKVPVGDRWVTSVAWSHPTCTRRGNSQSYLACALADGSVVVTTVIQTLEPCSTSLAFLPEHNVNVTIDATDDQVFSADHRGVTSLRWISTSQPEPILVFTKPGMVYLWTKPSAQSSWSDLRTIRLETQKLSVASTAFSRVSGIMYARRRDALVITLADGSFHVIQKLSTDPSLASGAPEDGLSCGMISKVARDVFYKVEEEDVTKADVNTIHGITSYDGDAFYTWIHESVQPNDFSYKHEAKHCHMVVTAQLWNGKTDDDVLEDIRTKLSNCKASSGESPLSSLRSIFLQLRDPDKLARLHPHVLSIIQAPPIADDQASTVMDAWTGELTSELRRQFQRSLRTHLFGRSSFLAQRMRVMLSGFCQKQSEDPAVKAKFEQAVTNTVASMWPGVLRIVIQHFASVLSLLSDDDMPFVLRIVVQALLPGTPADLQAEAQSLSTKIQETMSSSSDISMSSLGLDEQCPACSAHVSLQDISTATCPNGHIWPRCSVTSFILSTPMVRTCVGCNRKAFLPPPRDTPSPVWLPPSARSWVVEDLLHAVRRCFFCGSNFLSLV